MDEPDAAAEPADSEPAPDAEDKNLVQRLWREEECVDLDSIQFGDGRVVLLETPRDIPDAKTNASIRTLRRMRARDAIELPGVSCDPGLAATAGPPVRIAERGWIVTGGEGAGCGMMGYVAVSQEGDGRLVWLAFFRLSNPFAALEYEAGFVVGKTNLGARYVFPLDAPEKVQIQAAPAADDR